MTEKRTHSSAESDVAKRLLDRVKTHDRMTCGSDQALGYYSAWDAQLMRDAADEIERLRHDLDRHMQIAVDVLNDAQAVGMSEAERHAIAHARYQVEQASIVKPDCCFDYELVKDLLRVIDRASQPSLPSPQDIARMLWIKTRRYDPTDDQLAASDSGRECLALADAVLAMFASQPSPAATVETSDGAIYAAVSQRDITPEERRLIEKAILDSSAVLYPLGPVQRSSAATGYDEPQGYAASLRQQADWVEKARAGEMDSNDIDVDELRAAADFIERLTAVPQQVEVPFANMQFMGGDKSEYAVIRADDWRRFTAALALPRPEHS